MSKPMWSGTSGYLTTSAFFRAANIQRSASGKGWFPLAKPELSKAQQIAQIARAFERERTGHKPGSVTVVLSGDALVITLHGALSEAEKALSLDPDGAAKLREFHRQLFTSAAGELRRKIEQVTGVNVRDATAEIEPSSGTVVEAFPSGTVVQVFLLSGNVETDVWNDDKRSPTE